MKGKYEEIMIMQMLSSSNFRDQLQADQVQVELPEAITGSALSSLDRYPQDGTDRLATVQHSVSQSPEHQYRIGGYSMLAELLRQPPSQVVLDTVTSLADVVEKKDEFAIAMSMLGLAARSATENELDDEFHALFIGLGRGELVPYGCWYLTGFLMEKPLSLLRGDLAKMGFARSEGTCEPEDHVAALCEVMAMLIAEDRSLEVQQLFFETHVAPWLGQFFSDLSAARSAVFYRAVARFGKAFFDFEKQYLAMSA